LNAVGRDGSNFQGDKNPNESSFPQFGFTGVTVCAVDFVAMIDDKTITPFVLNPDLSGKD
ncbi:unnamed protein product, partial [Brassica rapa subsp. trilocularis]